MRNAATVLEIIRERGRSGLPLERVYRCMFNPDLFLLAYGKLYRNAGAMTPGITRETVDGTSLGKIEAIIGVLRQERYRWTPVRRTYLAKRLEQETSAGLDIHDGLLAQRAIPNQEFPPEMRSGYTSHSSPLYRISLDPWTG